MAEQRKMIIRLATDGTVQAETKNVYGDDCVPLAALLEDLCGAEAIDSSYTNDYYITNPGIEEVVDDDRDYS